MFHSTNKTSQRLEKSRSSQTIVMHFVLLLLFCFIHQGRQVENGYYWREFKGAIPHDAVAAGKDVNGNNVYIGQVYVKDCGLVVVQLASGVKEVFATIGGIHKRDKYIKILCGNQQNFFWLPANASDFHLITINKQPVVGGHEDSYGEMNIGRIAYEGEIKIGKVNAFWAGNAVFYFHHKGEEKLVNSYETLMYQDLDFKVDLRANSP